MLKQIFTALLILLFSGCLSPKLLAIHHYEPFVKESSNACESHQNQWLGAEVANKINGKNIAYKESLNKVEYFSKNQWITNLSDMLNTLIAKNPCIAPSQTPKIPPFLKVLAFNLHEESQVFFNAQVIITLGNITYVLPLKTTINVEKEGFEIIIKAMNQAIFNSFNDFFKSTWYVL